MLHRIATHHHGTSVLIRCALDIVYFSALVHSDSIKQWWKPPTEDTQALVEEWLFYSRSGSERLSKQDKYSFASSMCSLLVVCVCVCVCVCATCTIDLSDAIHTMSRSITHHFGHSYSCCREASARYKATCKWAIGNHGMWHARDTVRSSEPFVQ
jgi:hypothetical protein